ncbi:MAG: PilZ domain-containing protein [Desulfobacterales bacterium]
MSYSVGYQVGGASLISPNSTLVFNLEVISDQQSKWMEICTCFFVIYDVAKGIFMKIKRRKFVRYHVRPHTIFLYSNNSPVKGWVKDISSGGMAFEYTQIEGCEPKPESSLILMGDAIPFYLPDLPCKTIYCTKVNNSGRLGRVLQKRRCGVQYEKLDPELQEKITDLLSSEVIIDNSK